MAEELAAHVAEAADALYAGPPEQFTSARNTAAAGIADKAVATAVKKLRKPALAAWAVNNLVRREADQIEQVLALAESLRSAAEAMDGEELRALNRQRRQLTHALATSARHLATEQGIRLTDAVVDQVEGMLTAAMIDPVAAEVLRTGRVHTPFTSTGVNELDPAAVVAVPEALDVLAQPQDEPPEPAKASLRVVPDTGAKLAAAREALAEAEKRVAEAEQELADVEETVQGLNARRLQLQGEADELRRRLDAIETEVDEVDEELEEAGEARAEAATAVEEAEGARDRAHAALDRLGD